MSFYIYSVQIVINFNFETTMSFVILRYVSRCSCGYYNLL